MFQQNQLVLTNIHIEYVGDALQLANESTTNTQEAAARYEI